MIFDLVKMHLNNSQGFHTYLLKWILVKRFLGIYECNVRKYWPLRKKCFNLLSAQNMTNGVHEKLIRQYRIDKMLMFVLNKSMSKQGHLT